jgi:hypothetical protein
VIVNLPFFTLTDFETIDMWSLILLEDTDTDNKTGNIRVSGE